MDRAKESQIPMKFWSRLQKGETIEEEGMVYTPDLVLGEQRKGIKVTYCTDTRPVPVIAEEAKERIFLSVKECMENRRWRRKPWKRNI